MSLRDAVAWASSFDALLPHLMKPGGIAARASGGFYNLRGEPKERANDRILARWWTQLRDVDPAASRAWFYMALADQIDDELLQRARHPFGRNDVVITDDVLLAIGIELERGAVEALFPIAIADTPKAAEPASIAPPAPPSATSAAAAKKKLTCFDWVSDAVRDHPRAQKPPEMSYSSYLLQFAPEDWSARTISNELGRLARLERQGTRGKGRTQT
jgi:hypothetical protein